MFGTEPFDEFKLHCQIVENMNWIVIIFVSLIESMPYKYKFGLTCVVLCPCLYWGPFKSRRILSSFADLSNLKLWVTWSYRLPPATVSARPLPRLSTQKANYIWTLRVCISIFVRAAPLSNKKKGFGPHKFPFVRATARASRNSRDWPAAGSESGGSEFPEESDTKPGIYWRVIWK